ncbi:MAG TPA: FliH/SctL family protein [Polyangiaceae bacterium]|jgi:flagellar biosynthesis/type III secretory pathway protein FliH
MSLPRGRVVKHVGTEALPLLAAGPSPRQRRRVAREELEARLAAETLVRDAEEMAKAIVARAHEEGRALAAQAATAAREDADRQLTARWIALRDAESRRTGSDAERLVPLATALAERILCATLELQPDRIATLAAGVLAEARGARRATIHAHPADAEALRGQMVAAGLDPAAVDVQSDPALARGGLRLHTDVGVIDAQLAPRLDRLAEALRDALR